MKVKIISVLSAILVVFAAGFVFANAQEIKLGDINGDGEVSASDARKVLRFAAGLDDFSEADFVISDVNFDNEITAMDARMVLRASADIEDLPEFQTNETTTKIEDSEIPGKENYHGHVYAGGENSKKYHYEADCAGKYSHEISWDEVHARDLGPCGTCVLK